MLQQATDLRAHHRIGKRDEKIRLTEITVKLVGVDEADFSKGKINWLSPVGKALLKKGVGDLAKITIDGKSEELEILEIRYPLD